MYYTWSSDQETLLYLLRILNSNVASDKQKQDAARVKRKILRTIKNNKRGIK